MRGKRRHCLALLVGVLITGGCSASNEAAPSSSDKPVAPQTTSADKIVSTTPERQTISSGEYNTCIIENGRNLYCVGDNSFGLVGDGTVEDRDHPVTVNDATDAISVSVGVFNSCYLNGNGNIECWGTNRFGGVGDGSGFDQSTPVDVDVHGKVISFSVGSNAACASTTVGRVYCWGSEQMWGIGETGDDSIVSTPTMIEGITDATAVSVGSGMACAFADLAALRCWGYSLLGHVLPPSGSGSPVPLEVVMPEQFTSISVDGVGCGVTLSHKVACWGTNKNWQLGSNSSGEGTTAAFISGVENAVEVSVGRKHVCALIRDGSVLCWGANDSGQLGNGTTRPSQNPVAVQGLSNAKEISSGAFHTCARLADESIECWGSNKFGQFGGPVSEVNATPVELVVD